MTVADLITQVLRVIRNQFYADNVREFMRDEKALTMAIARYGYECNNRGWQFDAVFIEKQLLKLLNNIKTRSADIKYLPLYLEHAVDKSIRLQADNLVVIAKKKCNPSSPSKESAAVVSALMEKIKPAVVIKQTDTEVLAALYTDLKRHKNSRKKTTETKKPKAPEPNGPIQETLL